MFEYQTAISELTGLPVSNATLYEAPSRGRLRRLARAAAEQARALRRLARPAPALARGAGARRAPAGARRSRRSPLARRRDRRRRAARGDRRRRLGRVPAAAELPRRRRGPRGARRRPPSEAGALLVVQCDPITLGVLRPPGEFGVDIAVGEGQPLGNRLDYGGPSFGFFAAQEATCAGCRAGSPARRPTSTAAAASCSRCRRASSTSAARRRRTTSRTAQTLNALAGVVYLSWLGRRGIVELGELMLHRTAYARARAGRARRRRAAARAAGGARVRGAARRARRRA